MQSANECVPFQGPPPDDRQKILERLSYLILSHQSCNVQGVAPAPRYQPASRPWLHPTSCWASCLWIRGKESAPSCWLCKPPFQVCHVFIVHESWKEEMCHVLKSYFEMGYLAFLFVMVSNEPSQWHLREQGKARGSVLRSGPGPCTRQVS